MADSNVRGPLNAMGSLETQAGNTATIEPLDGVNMLYQGVAMPDIRSAPFAKDGFRPGQQPAFLSGVGVWAVDNIPQARGTQLLAATQVATALTAFSLATVGVAGVASVATIAVGVPIIPVGTTVATTVIALDFGFTTGSTVANSSTVDVIDNRLFRVNQWIIIGNVGNAAATLSLITQVRSIATANTTSITVIPVAGTTLINVPIGQGNLFGSALLPPATQFGPAAASANAHSFAGAFEAGLAKVINPRETLSRTINIATLTTVAFSAIVSGYDVWGNPMTELINVGATTVATSIAGDKAFKYISSIIPGTSVGTTLVSVGLGDTFGLPFRGDEWEQIEVNWNGASMANSNGFAPPITSTATNTTGDVRGTVQISTAVLGGALATSISAVASNGTGRLTIIQNIGVWNQVAGTPVNTVPMFGVPQA